MRTAFFGPLEEGSGWGEASKSYLLALDSVTNVSARPIILSGRIKPEGRIKELCHQPINNSDIIIQHCHPFMMVPTQLAKKNIGLFVTECSHFRNSNWTKNLNLMDEVWVPCRHNHKACINSGVTVPVKVVPHACNTDRYSGSIKQNDIAKRLKDEGNFVFYTICDFNPRKNLEATIRAFYLEFGPNEPVALIIKASSEDCSGQHLHSLVNDLVNKTIKESGILKKCRPIHIIVDRMTDDGLLGLHAASDAYIQTSYSEAWNIPAFDAMAMGKTPIVPNYSGFLEYVNEKTGWLVPTTIGYAYSLGHSEWNPMAADVEIGIVDLKSLRETIREVYEREDLREERALNGINKAFDFSFNRVGTQMLSHILEGLH